MNQGQKVTTVAGNGQKGFQDGNTQDAMFNYPFGICCSNDGRLYVTDFFNNRIRMIYNNQVSTIAGNGQKGFQDGNTQDAMFHYPSGICCSTDGRLYVSDTYNHIIRMIYNNQVSIIAGNGQRGFKDGNTQDAMFYYPSGICCSTDGRLYVADQSNNRIRMIYNNQVSTIAGNGQNSFKDGNTRDAMFHCPREICCSTDGRLYVVDQYNNRIRMIYNNQVSTIAGNGQKGFQDGNTQDAMFHYPSGICCSNDGRLYVSDQYNNRIRMIYNNQVSTIAGNGQKGFQDGNTQDAMFHYPSGICCSNDGRLYVSDQYNNRIRMIYNNQVSTIAGNRQKGSKDGNTQDAMFSCPSGICCSTDGRLYVSDQSNNSIRMIETDQYHSSLQTSSFGFALLLDMQNTFSDCQISFNNITYHLHRVLINVRCPLLLDQSYFGLLQQSNISNESFDSFVTFLYSNKFKLTKEQNRILATTISIISLVELIFIFDIFMDCKSMLIDLRTRFERKLIEILNIEQVIEVKTLMLELLPFIYNLKEIKTKHVISNIKSNISSTEYCYDKLIHELQKKRSIIALHLHDLQQKMTIEAFMNVVQMLTPETSHKIELLDDESMIVFGAELTELSKLAFEKTNICEMEKTETKLESTKHLDTWTRPDFVIKLSNHDEIEYHVHKLILCGRWKYFRLMIESGLKEANDNQMTLSDDWNRSRIVSFLKYIYLNEIEFDSLEDVEWLMENRKLYGISVQNDQNKNNNQDSDKIENKNETGADLDPDVGAYGFEALYKHCLDRLRQRS